MNALVRLALRNGWRRGFLHGSRPWVVAGSVAILVRVVQRMIGSGDKVVFMEVLRPGETIVIGRKRSD